MVELFVDGVLLALGLFCAYRLANVAYYLFRESSHTTGSQEGV